MGVVAIALAARIASSHDAGSEGKPTNRAKPTNGAVWQLQALCLPAFAVVMYLGLAPRMSRGYDATRLREGQVPPNVFERFLEQPGDLLVIALSLAALIAIGRSCLRDYGQSASA